MNSSSSSISQSSLSMAANNSAPSTDGKKVRKPYTITKSRESWTDEEHDKFLEALQLFDRDWKKIEDFVGSKTVIQIRSHAQKYFLKVQKNGTIAHVPPPRPKRKATHPYPQKAPKNVLSPVNASMAYPSSLNPLAPGYSPWDDTHLLNTLSGGSMASQDEYAIGVEGMLITLVVWFLKSDTGSKGVARFSNSRIDGGGSSGGTLPTSELEKQGKQSSLLHGIPDFAEVYSFIGSVFDPGTNGHVQKLKEMDPINFETVLLLMRNLTINLSSPDFEPFKEELSSYDVDAKTVGIAAGNVAVSDR
ncbi:hypothetical protein RHGRI_015092 [Rhododendron griersonianum]|uniref:Uncharacterized protein n=1 Tax=Rhododendron griersonianum TaxID=479676 RepID=A0AAV6KCF7_9ERIC|nr:hypothetical protein RHGRI_015092 [Rhododendron griersonianum]